MAYSDMVPVLSLVPEPNFYPAMCLSLRESRMWLLVRQGEMTQAQDPKSLVSCILLPLVFKIHVQRRHAGRNYILCL